MKALDRIDAQTDALRRMIDQLLDVTRAEMGQEPQPRPEVLDLADLVERLVEQQQTATEAHRFDLTVASRPLMGHWDSDFIERIVGNLLGNAVKYSPQGGRISVMVASDPGSRGALVRVQDEGIGVPTEALPHIFERFYRARNTTTAAGEPIPGLGLGLFGAQRLAQALGGRIEVASEVGKGSTFTLVLPSEGPDSPGDPTG